MGGGGGGGFTRGAAMYAKLFERRGVGAVRLRLGGGGVQSAYDGWAVRLRRGGGGGGGGVQSAYDGGGGGGGAIGKLN